MGVTTFSELSESASQEISQSIERYVGEAWILVADGEMQVLKCGHLGYAVSHTGSQELMMHSLYGKHLAKGSLSKLIGVIGVQKDEAKVLATNENTEAQKNEEKVVTTDEKSEATKDEAKVLATNENVKFLDLSDLYNDPQWRSMMSNISDEKVPHDDLHSPLLGGEGKLRVSRSKAIKFGKTSIKKIADELDRVFPLD